MKWKPARLALITAAFVLLFSYFSYRLGNSVGQSYAANKIYSSVHDYPLAFSEVLRLRNYRSNLGQDRWIVNEVFQHARNGFFLDVGSADGLHGSNTRVLEELGWTGICIDPFPTNMEGRTCEMFETVVSSEAGQRVNFTAAGVVGGITEHLGLHKGHELVKRAQTVELVTTTLNDLLEQANAPRNIDYLSLDVEGAELEVLKGLDLSKYRFKALTIEHNFEEPKRSEIREMLMGAGYQLAVSMHHDDWYLDDSPGSNLSHARLLSQ